jgi:hypothetical protein
MVEHGGIYVTRPIPFSRDAPKNAKHGSKLQERVIQTYSVYYKSAMF